MLLVSQISEMLRAIKCDRKVSDRRRAPRVGLRARVDMVTSPEAPAAASVWIRNISLSGVGLLHTRKLAEGSMILLRFHTIERKMLSVPCEVIHCYGIPNQFFRIGAKFLGEPFGVIRGHPIKIESRVPGPAEPQIVVSAN
ncbi:MAG TPA: PilZ domain-containing protein [Tepidisphaeraceae bacterium]|jgi:hypothetical protein|nr:PilZ domain-containing protein [Tepidisphaeraceae bacterium]